MNCEPKLNHREGNHNSECPEGQDPMEEGESDKKKGGSRKEFFWQLLMIRQTHVEVQRFALIYISITKIRQEGS